jgi:hypothetical protein
VGQPPYLSLFQVHARHRQERHLCNSGRATRFFFIQQNPPLATGSGKSTLQFLDPLHLHLVPIKKVETQLLVEGKISNQTFEEWNRETGAKKLPERVVRKKAKKKHTRRKTQTRR